VSSSAQEVYDQAATPDDDGVDLPCSPLLTATESDSTRGVCTV